MSIRCEPGTANGASSLIFERCIDVSLHCVEPWWDKVSLLGGSTLKKSDVIGFGCTSLEISKSTLEIADLEQDPGERLFPCLVVRVASLLMTGSADRPAELIVTGRLSIGSGQARIESTPTTPWKLVVKGRALAHGTGLSESEQEHSTGALLSLHNVNLRLAAIGGGFSKVSMDDCTFGGCRWECSADRWEERDTVHDGPNLFVGPFRRPDKRIGCTWAPEIRGACKMSGVTFSNSRVDTGVLATHCFDRSTIQLRHNIESVDRWETLRDKYTGFMLAIHLGLTASFLISVLLRIGAYSALSHEDLLGGTPDGWRRLPLWKLLVFGLGDHDTKWAKLNAASFALLVIYNSMRAWTTIGVAAIRQREDHLASQGYRSCRPDVSKFSLYMKLHWVLSRLWLLVVASILIKFIDLLMTTVALPG